MRCWALFVLLLSTLLCCQPTELIWVFYCFINFPVLPPPELRLEPVVSHSSEVPPPMFNESLNFNSRPSYIDLFSVCPPPPLPEFLLLIIFFFFVFEDSVFFFNREGGGGGSTNVEWKPIHFMLNLDLSFFLLSSCNPSWIKRILPPVGS